MCKNNDTVDLLVPISAGVSYTGKFRWALKPVDRCIASYVKALNDAGLYTEGCCCGHGGDDGNIVLHDGTVFHIEKVASK